MFFFDPHTVGISGEITLPNSLSSINISNSEVLILVAIVAA